MTRRGIAMLERGSFAGSKKTLVGPFRRGDTFEEER